VKDGMEMMQVTLLRRTLRVFFLIWMHWLLSARACRQ